MKRNRINMLYGLVLACGLILAGCNEESLPGDNIPENAGTTLTLLPSFSRDVTVKSVTGANETLISNVWVIQLDASGNVLQDDYKPLYLGTVDAAGTSGNYTIDVRLSPDVQEVLFIANTGLSDLFDGVSTKADVAGKTMTVNSESSLASQTGMVMCGTWTPGKSYDRIYMSRAIAKVDFTLEANESFVLQGIAVKNVPTTLHYYRDSMALEADGETVAYYPATNGLATADWEEALTGDSPVSQIWTDLQWLPADSDLKGIHLKQSKTFTWYLPENGRGIGTATGQRDKNALTAAEGQAGFCTYIQVKGFYRTEALVTGVTYNIYLGENNYNNYNIIRNTNYKVTTKILGIDRTDTRISKETGEEIEPVNYFDYTDNGSPWFVIAADNNGSTNWENPTLPGEGWVMPTKKEMMLAWIYEAKRNPNPFGSTICWLDEKTATSRWSINMEIGEVILGQGGENSYVLHTIKKPDNSAFLKYPYVQGGKEKSNVIVSRDVSGGVKAEYVRDPNKVHWTETPQHNERSSENIVAAKFEVAPFPPDGPTRIRRDWTKAQEYCNDLVADGHDDWRMPTQRELMLMFVLNDQLKDPLLTQSQTDGTGGGEEMINHAFYWSATEDGTQAEALISQTGWSVCFCQDNPDDPTGKTEGYAKTATNYIRCVRDVLDND